MEAQVKVCLLGRPGGDWWLLWDAPALYTTGSEARVRQGPKHWETADKEEEEEE